jgi:hypothetical protein
MGEYVMATAEIKRHWSRVAALGCIVSEGPATIHHCKGGSMLLIPGLAHPGGAQKQNDWLVIPLAERLHTGDLGIDNGMGPFKSKEMWEAHFGQQSAFLDEVCRRLGYNVWKMAGVDRQVEGL